MTEIKWASNKNHNDLLISKIVLCCFPPFGLSTRSPRSPWKLLWKNAVLDILWLLLQSHFPLFSALLYPHEAVLQMDSIHWGSLHPGFSQCKWMAGEWRLVKVIVSSRLSCCRPQVSSGYSSTRGRSGALLLKLQLQHFLVLAGFSLLAVSGPGVLKTSCLNSLGCHLPLLFVSPSFAQTFANRSFINSLQ